MGLRPLRELTNSRRYRGYGSGNAGLTELQAAPEVTKAYPRLPMLLMSVQEVSNQLGRVARDAGHRGAVTKGSDCEVLKEIEVLFRREMFFYADDGSATPAQKSSLPIDF